MIAGIISSAPAARASEIYDLTQDGCSSSCGTGPYGEIILSQTNPDTVTVEVMLSSGVEFVNTGAGSALDFEIEGAAPTVAIQSESQPSASDYTVGGSDHASAFGYFDLSIDCSGCGNGGSSPLPGPLAFTVSRSTGLTISDFITSADHNNGAAGATDYYFASDIMGTTGKTGDVAAVGPAEMVTPEPSYQILLVGLLGFVFWLRRKRFARADSKLLA